MILVSACLLGHKVRYNAGENTEALLVKYEKCGKFIVVCPECLAKLPIPRPPAEIVGGCGEAVLQGKCKVMSRDGKDMTQSFVMGAERVLRIARQHGVKYAILKERSPSCGVRQIYDGSFSGEKIAGRGVTASILNGIGVRLYTEEDVTSVLLEELMREIEMG